MEKIREFAYLFGEYYLYLRIERIFNKNFVVYAVYDLDFKEIEIQTCVFCDLNEVFQTIKKSYGDFTMEEIDTGYLIFNVCSDGKKGD